MSIEWISVKTRVPDDRRKVLAWGLSIFVTSDECFLGGTSFNPSNNGGKFDVEIAGRVLTHTYIVTHWAEITGPFEP